MISARGGPLRVWTQLSFPGVCKGKVWPLKINLFGVPIDHEVFTDGTLLLKNKDDKQHNDCQQNKKNKGKKTKAEKKKNMKKMKADTKTTKVDAKKIKMDTKKIKVDTKKTKDDTKKTKVNAKEKRLNDKKAKQTKSKKFHRRLISLFCCCVLSQEKNEEFCEIEQSTAKNKSNCEDQNSFQSIDLNH